MAIWYEVAFNGAHADPDLKHHSLEEAKSLGWARLADDGAESFTVFEVDDRNGVGAVAAMHSVFESHVPQ
jgi:hypothetical protein